MTRAVLSVYLVQAAFGFLLAGLGPCLVLLARDLEVERTSLSWVSAGFGAGLLLVGATGEHLLRIGAWRLLRTSAVTQCVGTVLLAVASSDELAQAGALLLGLGGAGLVLSSPVLLSRAGTARMSLAFGLSSLTGIATPLLISAVDAATEHGRRALLISVPFLLGATLPFFHAPGTSVPAPPPHPRARSLPAPRWEVVAWWACIVAAVSPEFAFVVWGAARLQDGGLGPAAASAAAAAFPIGMSLGRLVIVPRLLGRFPLVRWGAALAIAGGLTCAAPCGPVPLTIASGLAGLGLAPLYPLTLAGLLRVPGIDPHRGTAVGALGSGTAVLFAPLLLGVLSRAVSLRLGFLVVVPLLLAVVAIHARARGAARYAGSGSKDMTVS